MAFAMFILYVADQQASRDFYRSVLGHEPSLDVPGMTEFELGAECSLGLMPEDGIHRIIGDALPHPREGRGGPRAELYLRVEDVQASYDALLNAGGTPVSPPALRNWGDVAAYGTDPDGHVVALAMKG
jgi:catechol 2,3-dioxygenase-like lactoylglutathione lyase family enzyme